jgi:uncharacterized protein
LISKNYVAEIFDFLRTAENDKFFSKVADDVNWTVMGTHPLAGTYTSKNIFVEKTFHRLNKILKEGVILKVNNIIIEDNIAVVEMESLATAKNGIPFNNKYCWIVRFENDFIVEVRAYLDSALVQRVLDENEK